MERIVLIDNEDGRLSVDVSERYHAVFVHAKIWRFSRRKLGEYEATFRWLLDVLRGVGYCEVYATPFETNKMARKFISHFGFREIRRGKGMVLMQRSTEHA